MLTPAYDVPPICIKFMGVPRQAFSSPAGEVGGFGITIGGFWGTYTASHGNILIGNALSNFHPTQGTHYLGQDAYGNVIKGNAGTVGYDSWEPSPIQNNSITGVTSMAGGPRTGCAC
jgi:hypothetical protein